MAIETRRLSLLPQQLIGIKYVFPRFLRYFFVFDYKKFEYSVYRKKSGIRYCFNEIFKCTGKV